jgi:low affinity Fe/Cu permease
MPGTFVLIMVCVLAWLAAGPAFQFSDKWLLVINTAISVFTFLMVFLDSSHSEPRHACSTAEA